MSPSIPLVLTTVAVLGLLGAETAHNWAARAVTKTTASLAFIAYGFALGLHTEAFGQAVIGALILSAVGDVALLWRSKAPFLGGLVAFLLAHVGYVVAFLLLGVAPAGFLLALPCGLAAWAVWRWLSPSVGSLRKPVAAYVVVITTMVVCSGAAWLAHPSPGRAGLFAAATAFYLSDLCVARDRFVAPGIQNRLVGLPLYYGAQLAFAAAAALALSESTP
jgi:uncharacterized membrane protein YhhN